ncbi:MAG: hypothetical protein AB8G99_12255 [Planctomycetaceae bacterium]
MPTTKGPLPRRRDVGLAKVVVVLAGDGLMIGGCGWTATSGSPAGASSSGGAVAGGEAISVSAFAGAAGATGCCGGRGSGTSNGLLHRGHLPRLPAALSFTRIVDVQYGQLNSIAMAMMDRRSLASFLFPDQTLVI